VLVEKPLASSLDDARALAAAAERHPDRVAAVGYCHRFTPALLEAARRVAEGDIGRLTRFENTFAFHHPGMADAWFSDPATSGGGSFFDTGCHSLDVFQFLVGRPELVGIVTDHAWEGRGDSSATALVRAADGPACGVAGVILAGWLEPARFQVRLVGTEGGLFYDYERAEALVRTAPDGSTTAIPVETHEVRFERQLGAFLRAVQSRTPASEAGLASFGAGLSVAEAVDSSRR
jgi:predicted dehydrogenase